jgi:hypothetical protein
VCSAGDLPQSYAITIGVGSADLAGQSGLKTAEDDGVSLEGNEEILLRVDDGGTNGEEAVAGVGEFVGSAVVEMGGIGNSDEDACGRKTFVRDLTERKTCPPRKAAATKALG